MQFELVTTDGSGKPPRIVDEGEATRLLREQYKHTDFLEGLKSGGCASVEGGILRQVQDAELLPCPFCGGSPGYETTSDHDDCCHCVRCETCNFDLMNGPHGIGWHGTKAEAASAWNRRMQPNMSSDQIDAARYRWWREHVDAIAEDEAGVHGLAFSCQVPFSMIEKATTAELMNMIADHHLPPNV